MRVAMTALMREIETRPHKAGAAAAKLASLARALGAEEARIAAAVPQYPGCPPGMTPQDMMDAHQAMEDEITELIEARVQERVAPRLEEAVEARLAEMGLAEMRPACAEPRPRFGEGRGEEDGDAQFGNHVSGPLIRRV